MKRTALIMLAALIAASPCFAVKGPQGIKYTRHNLGSTSDSMGYSSNWLGGGPNYLDATNEDEVCIFCHTPHGGTASRPLWNRDMPTQTFTHYSSTTLSAPMQALSTTRAVNDESLACLSCHDGAIAMNSILNYSNRTGDYPDNAMTINSMFFSVGAKIGDAPDGTGFSTLGVTDNLTDDHPISFNYYTVSTDPSNASVLRTVAVAEAGGVVFFPRNGAATEKRVECSTCHDPHVNYEAGNGGNAAYAPFLITPNTGSAMCLSCHIK